MSLIGFFAVGMLRRDAEVLGLGSIVVDASAVFAAFFEAACSAPLAPAAALADECLGLGVEPLPLCEEVGPSAFIHV